MVIIVLRKEIVVSVIMKRILMKDSKEGNYERVIMKRIITKMSHDGNEKQCKIEKEMKLNENKW